MCIRDRRIEARAHRALDDCVALAAIVEAAAGSVGVKPGVLLARFAVKLNETATTSQLASLL